MTIIIKTAGYMRKEDAESLRDELLKMLPNGTKICVLNPICSVTVVADENEKVIKM